MSDAARLLEEARTIAEMLFTGGYDATEGEDGSRDTTWTDFGIVCGFVESLAAELQQLREALARLGSAELFVPGSLYRDADLAEELVLRATFARAALAGSTAARQETT